jgi:hypothetical protein
MQINSQYLIYAIILCYFKLYLTNLLEVFSRMTLKNLDCLKSNIRTNINYLIYLFSYWKCFT